MSNHCKAAVAASVSFLFATCSPPASSTTAPAPSSAAATAPAATPAVSASSTKAARNGDPTRLDDKGYIRQWLILAPINFGEDYNAEDIDKEQIPGESDLTPKAGDKQKVQSHEKSGDDTKVVEKELTWQPLVTDDYFFDINDFLGLDTSESVGSYAVTYLDAPEDMSGITFSLCSNDDGVIYLNGKKIYSFVGGRSLSEDADAVDNLTLHKGINPVIFKVWNDANAWQGCIRLLTKDGKPVDNVRVRLST